MTNASVSLFVKRLDKLPWALRTAWFCRTIPVALFVFFCVTPVYAQVGPDLPEASLASEALVPPATPANPPSGSHAPPVATLPPPSETIHAEVGTRLALRLQNASAGQQDQLRQVGVNGEADVVLWGKLCSYLGWQAGFLGTMGEPDSSAVATGSATATATTTTTTTKSGAEVLDLVAKLELAEAVNLWVGRMPMASDRTSLSTVWGIAPWMLPGSYDFYGGALASGPRRGQNDRGDGATLWGQFGGGRLKYYAGAFGLEDPKQSPLCTARLALSLLSPEPGFRTRSAYYGTKNVLALGAGFQHQMHGSHPPAGSTAEAGDFNEFNADLLFEKNGGQAGVLNLEGAFAKMWGNNEWVNYQLFVLASYLVPLDLGIGRFQPLVRFQRASGHQSEASNQLDAQLGYVIDGNHARAVAVYQYTQTQGQPGNAVLLGLQLLTR